MKAVVLKKYGAAAQAFEFRDMPEPIPSDGEVLIQVELSGLNFADVMARKGLYKEAPPLPCVLGYDVVGTIIKAGKATKNVNIGDRVMAFTRFGGYAEKVITDARAAALIPAGMDANIAIALTTQYCTAWYAAVEMVNLHKGDKVLVQAGAGGVGIALIQFAKYRQCEIFATAGSPEKIEYLKQLGVHHPISYRTQDFEKEINKITNGTGIDVIFDAVGGSSVKKGLRSLGAGGRLVCYGASVMTDKNLFGKIKAGLSFGFYHPAMLMMPSKSIIGVNMLKVADRNPEMMQLCLESVMKLASEGVFVPRASQVFPIAEIAKVHGLLENRQTIGKVAMKW
ncbi:medium chain dehydrogenase/reductase family protein [soil metagenome]